MLSSKKNYIPDRLLLHTPISFRLDPNEIFSCHTHSVRTVDAVTVTWRSVQFDISDIIIKYVTSVLQNVISPGCILLWSPGSAASSITFSLFLIKLICLHGFYNIVCRLNHKGKPAPKPVSLSFSRKPL